MTDTRPRDHSIMIAPKFSQLSSNVDVCDLEKVSPLKSGNSETTFVGIGNRIPQTDCVKLILNSNLSHIIQTECLDYASEMDISYRMLTQPQSFFRNPQRFLLGEHYNGKTFSLSSLKQKNTILETVEEFLVRTSGAPTIQYSVLLMADELLTNSIFHTPIYAGNHNKAENNVLDEDLVSDLFIAENSQSLVIGSVNPFGTLDLDRLFSRIAVAHDKGLAKAIRDEHPYGAGIGWTIMINLAASIYIGIDEGRRCVIALGLPLRKSYRKVEGMAKNFHFIKGVAGRFPVYSQPITRTKENAA